VHGNWFQTVDHKNHITLTSGKAKTSNQRLCAQQTVSHKKSRRPQQRERKITTSHPIAGYARCRMLGSKHAIILWCENHIIIKETSRFPFPIVLCS
jgi:hypothetical protein